MKKQYSWGLICVALAMLVLSLACGAGSAAPLPAVGTESALNPLASPTLFVATPAATAEAVSAPPAILEARSLILEWPSRIRLGDSDVVHLTLDVGSNGSLTPTAEIAGHVTSGQTVFIPDVYATHNVIAEARLELAGVQMDPSGPASQHLGKGQKVTFFWSIRPGSIGKYRGIAWFSLRFVPLAGGAESEQTLAAFPLEFDTVSFLGLKAGPARLLGAVGTFISSLLGLPFLEQGLRWLWKRIKKVR